MKQPYRWGTPDRAWSACSIDMTLNIDLKSICVLVDILLRPLDEASRDFSKFYKENNIVDEHQETFPL
jgi:hypothetical protein